MKLKNSISDKTQKLLLQRNLKLKFRLNSKTQTVIKLKNFDDD